jgi:hypothetical protein
MIELFDTICGVLFKLGVILAVWLAVFMAALLAAEMAKNTFR